MRLLVVVAAFLTACHIMAQPIQTDKGATQAAIIIDLATGDVVYDYNADTKVTPASLTKLFTTAAAIETLGATSKIETRVYLDGNDIVVRGHSDPTIGSRHYTWHSINALGQIISDALISRNISHIENIRLDNGFLQGSPLHSKHLWEDMGNYYGATPSAFIIADNTQIIEFSSPDKPGEECTVTSLNPNIGTKPVSHVKSYLKQADSVYVYGTGEDRYVSGCMPCSKQHFKVKASLPYPEKYFGERLLMSLKTKGIGAGQLTIKRGLSRNAQLIATFASPSIESIAKTTNHESDNLYAESLLLQLSQGEETTFDEGVASLRKYVEKATNQKAQLYDGSGLSPLNTTTPTQVVALLRHMLTSQYAQHYENTLARAGIEGTLKRIGKNTPIEGNVKGKSGSMTGVLGYAGTFTSQSGRRLAFCIIINHSGEPNSSMRTKIAKWLENCVSEY